MEEKNMVVLVLSRNYSTGLSVIRSLGAAGYTVDLLFSAFRKGKSKIPASSKYVRKCVEVVSRKVKNGGDNKLLIELLKLGEQYPEKAVLFPTDDYTTSVMDLNRETLEKYFIMPTIVGGTDGCLTERMDKTVQAEMARKAGLCTPLEWIFNLEEEIVVPEDMVYPCFCKPIESVTGYKKEMATCHNEEELKKHLGSLKKSFSKRSILVQEFLQIDQEIDLSGVCLDQKIIIPAIIKKTNVAQYEKGVTLAGKVVPFDEISEIKDNVIAMLKDFHYVGMFDMELNIVGDKIYFNEVNLRSGGPNYSYFKSGVNLPALFVKEALGEGHAPEEEHVSEFGKSFIYEKVAWEDYIHGFMTKKELNETIKKADITLLYNKEDPQPEKMFKIDIQLANLNNKRRKIKNRIKKFFGAPKRKLSQAKLKIKRRILKYPQYNPENDRNPEAEKPRVLVSGQNYCSNLCLARSLGQAGYEVEILKIFQRKPKRWDLMKQLKPDAYSKYVKAYRVCVTNRKSQRIVKKMMRIADPDRKMLLVPADDLVAGIIDRYYEKLSEHYILPNIDEIQGEIVRLMSKERQKELAKEAGIPVLNSCVIRKRNGKFEIPETVTYPCFVKPNVSKNGSKGRMKKCENEAELIRALRLASAGKRRIGFLVEDYVEIKREYSLLGLSTKEGAIGPGFFGVVEGGHNERRGVSLVGELLPCSQHQELIDRLVDFVGSLNYDGLYDIDLIEAEEGKMYFTELNLRFGASGYAATECGVNLPGMYADYMLFGKKIDKECKLQESGKRFVSEKVILEEYMRSFLKFGDIRKKMDQADVHFVYNEDDMQPYLHYKKFYKVAMLGKLYFKISSPIKSLIRRVKRKLRKGRLWLRRLVMHYPQFTEGNARNPEAEKPRVIVSGRNYCSNLCMARALGQAGYEVEILRIFQTKPKRLDIMKQLKPDAYSKYIKAYHVCVSNRNSTRVVKSLIRLADQNRKMLLIPADDLVANIVDENYEKLSAYYVMPNVDDKQGEISRLMSKEAQKELAREAGLPLINSCVIRTENGMFTVPETVKYPCFIKPNISKNSSKSRMRKCADEMELKSAISEFSRRKDIEMLVEDYVEIGREYSLLGVSTKEGVVGPGYFGAVEGGHKERRGVAMIGEILPCAEQQELIDQLIEFISTLKFDGLYDVDLIQSVDGTMYFVELNLRFGASGYAVAESGVNLPGMFADYMLLGKPITTDCKVENPGKQFISEKVMLDEYIGGFLSFSEMKKKMKQVDIHFVYNAEDVQAYQHFKKFYKVAVLLKFYKKVAFVFTPFEKLGKKLKRLKRKINRKLR